MYTFYWLKFIHNRTLDRLFRFFFLLAPIFFSVSQIEAQHTFFGAKHNQSIFTQLSTIGFRNTQSDSSCYTCFTKRFTYLTVSIPAISNPMMLRIGENKNFSQNKISILPHCTTQARVSPTRFEWFKSRFG